MVMEYTIVGGCLKIHRNVFIQEMLRKDSKLRALLNWKNLRDFTACHPAVNEAGQENIITVDFTGLPGVELQTSPKDILGELKARYKEKIKGRVSCRMMYSMFGGVYHFDLDLNSDGDQI